MSKPELIIMTDIETLDVGPRSVITQAAFVAAAIDDPEIPIHRHLIYLPIQPQITLQRTISAETIAWWMKQDEEARLKIAESTGDEFEELPALLRAFNRKLDQVSDGRTYEFWARGPQFDVVNLESLMGDCAVQPHWEYQVVRDLRTLMAIAGLKTADVERPPELTAHQADKDCQFQLMCYAAAMRELRRA